MTSDSLIVLIGPLKAGKSTVRDLLAAQLGWPAYSLDQLERAYIEPLGFDAERARRIHDAEGSWAWYSYRRQYFASAVECFLSEHPAGVLELGGGHPIAPDAVRQARIDRALAPLPYVVLLLPHPDLAESRRILKTRQRPDRLSPDFNDHLLADDRFLRLAKHVVITARQTPEETASVVLRVTQVS
ncbi:shikimate kinase [Promineifilum sp.]|uniref:shikimate kinase n=1 Tax=Promineifilum sp. TaxID=2664178 RepID=UPI0035B4CB65